MPPSQRAVNNLSLLSSTSLSTQHVRSVLLKSTLILFFNTLPLKKSPHCTAGLKRQQRTAVQKRDLGVPCFNKAPFKRGDFTEAKLGFEVNHSQTCIQRDFHLSPLYCFHCLNREQTREQQYASGRIFWPFSLMQGQGTMWLQDLNLHELWLLCRHSLKQMLFPQRWCKLAAGRSSQLEARKSGKALTCCKL